MARKGARKTLTTRSNNVRFQLPGRRQTDRVVSIDALTGSATGASDVKVLKSHYGNDFTGAHRLFCFLLPQTFKKIEFLYIRLMYLTMLYTELPGKFDEARNITADGVKFVED